MIRLSLVLAFALIPAAAAAGTADEENAKDMRCLIVTSEMADSKDKDVETAGLIASEYDLGRIDGRSPGTDLEKLLVQEAVKLSDEARPGLMMACAKQIEERGKHLEIIGGKVAGAKS